MLRRREEGWVPGVGEEGRGVVGMKGAGGVVGVWEISAMGLVGRWVGKGDWVGRGWGLEGQEVWVGMGRVVVMGKVVVRSTAAL